MSKQDFFRILIRIFALYMIVQSLFTIIPQSWMFTVGEFDFGGIAAVVIALIVIIALLYVLIVKADWVIRILKLNKGFDSDHIDFKGISTETILKFGIIFVGGIFILNNIVTLLSSIGLIFRSLFVPETEVYNKYLPHIDYIQLIISAVNVLLGYLILTNVDRVSRWLRRYEKVENEA
jgi:hypothetical protein